MDRNETVAAYVGVLRHTLRIAPGADALMELEGRLSPPDPSQRPPARAPGIARLSRALKQLRRGAPPADTIEAFRDDLAFLKVFDQDTSWTSEALDDLAANVLVADESRRRPAPATATATNASTNVVPLRRKRPSGDA